ncbi:MAG: nitroreductase family protein [Treponema sp.]|nr:nitroreductase family protein [Treponema sp.]
MDALDAIKRRYSFRGIYKNIPVPRDDLKKIIEAGIAAPSGCNKQTTAFVGLDDQTLVNSIMELAKKNGYAGVNALAAICILTQKTPSYADKYFYAQDYSAAIENILIAVTALGYASCWVEGQITEDPQVQEQIAQMLNVPGEYTVVAFLPIGIPEKEGKGPERKPFEERAWFNKC